MATGTILTDMGAIDVSLVAASDLSSKQYFAMKVDTSNECEQAGANEKVLGILQNAPEAGETARVRIQGVTKIIPTETLAFGNFLTPTATGELEICDAANEEFCARSLGIYVDGDQAEALIAFGEVTASDA